MAKSKTVKKSKAGAGGAAGAAAGGAGFVPDVVVPLEANAAVLSNNAASYSGRINDHVCAADEDPDTCMRLKFDAVGLTLVSIIGDGNCLFHSTERFFNIYNFPDQVKTHLAIRKEVNTYLKANAGKFLESFQVSDEGQAELDSLREVIISKGEENAANALGAINANAYREAQYALTQKFVNHELYLEAKLDLFKDAIAENNESGTFASGIGDIMPFCIAPCYNLRVSIYDYNAFRKQFDYVNIDPSEITGKPTRGHLRLHRVNGNHFNLLIPTVTIGRFPRVKALTDYYTSLFEQLELSHDVATKKLLLRHVEKAEQPARAAEIVDLEGILRGPLKERLAIQLEAVIAATNSKWKGIPTARRHTVKKASASGAASAGAASAAASAGAKAKAAPRQSAAVKKAAIAAAPAASAAAAAPASAAAKGSASKNKLNLLEANFLGPNNNNNNSNNSNNSPKVAKPKVASRRLKPKNNNSD